MPAAAGDSGTEDARFAAAHAALRADTSIQHTLPPVVPDPPPPAWAMAIRHVLERVGQAIGRFFAWAFRWLPPLPWAQILLWSVLALVAALLLWMIVERLRTGSWRLPQWRRQRVEAGTLPTDAEADWAPQAGPARALLKDADRLAAEGRFAEAVHLLLHRSVEEIGRRRPGTLRPALTSREIADLPSVPRSPRTFFATIAGAVERSLFAGHPVDHADWEACRSAYADFALPRGWAA